MVSNLIKADRFEDTFHVDTRIVGFGCCYFYSCDVWRIEMSFTELTEAALKANTRINFTLLFAPTLTTNLIFENSGCSDIFLDIHPCFPPRSALTCIYNYPWATCINQHQIPHPINIDAYHQEHHVHILVGEKAGTHAFSPYLFPEQFWALCPRSPHR